MRQKHLILGLLFLVLCSFVALISVSQQKSLLQLENEKDAAWNVLYNPESGAWPEYKSAFDKLQGKIQKFIEDHGKLKGIKLSPKLDPANQLLDGISKGLTAKRLTDSMRQQLVEIEQQGNHVEFLWLDVQAAWYAYYDAVGAYNYEVSPEERIGIREPEKLVPTPLYFCYGPCDELFETAGGAQFTHQVYCSEKHGTSGTTGVTFYICSDSATCDRSDEHWRVCGGTCGEKFAPKRISRGQGNYDYVADSAHYVTCSHESCSEEYYTCQYSTCPQSSTHVSSSNPIATPPPTPTPTPSPTYHACGVHETSVSGDHSLQASCSSSNSNGNCTVTNFYAC